MTIIWNKIKNSIIHTLNESLDKTEELTSIGRIKLEILRIEHQLDDQYAELGKYCYKYFSKMKNHLPSGEKFPDVKIKIDKLEKELSKKEKELGRIREKEGIDFGA